MEARNQLLGLAAQSKILAGVRPNGLNDEPQYQLVIDDEKAHALGLSLSDINSTLSIALGRQLRQRLHRPRSGQEGLRAGQSQRADEPGRLEEVVRAQYRRRDGAVCRLRHRRVDLRLAKAVPLQRRAGRWRCWVLRRRVTAPATRWPRSSRLAKKLPAGVGLSWTGLSYEERLSGSQAPALYALSLLMVFLCLAALYESWSIPIAVMLVVPLGIIGALLATSLRGLSNDVYFQVGLLDDHRSGGEKRHPDRRVRQETA